MPFVGAAPSTVYQGRSNPLGHVLYSCHSCNWPLIVDFEWYKGKSLAHLYRKTLREKHGIVSQRCGLYVYKKFHPDMPNMEISGGRISVHLDDKTDG
jgi:hypothetical protein